MTTRRWMVAVVVVALLSWLGLLSWLVRLYRRLFAPYNPDPFDATEMSGPNDLEPK